MLAGFFLPDFGVAVGADYGQYFHRIVFIVNVEMSHIRKFLNQDTAYFFVPNSINLRVFAQCFDLLNCCSLEPSTKSGLLFGALVGNFLDIGKGFRFNFYFVPFHQALSVFLVSSQSKSRSGFFLTLSKRSITSFWWASGISMLSFSLFKA